MVAVVRDEFLAAAAKVLAKWELHWAVIGETTPTRRLRALHGGEIVGDIPARLLTEECPRHRLDPEPRTAEVPRATKPPIRERLASPRHRSRRWIFEQYDHLVGSRTVRRPGLDAAVLRLRPSLRGLAVSLDGPPPGERDPFRCGAVAVLEAARNVACAGGEPLALTDCLNFGNPEKPEIAWELEQAIEGIASGAEALRVPIVSGNVSLYNETNGRAIPPTPVVGCVGLVADVRQVPDRWRPTDVVLLAEAGGDSLEDKAALIGFVWRSAPLLTLAHDVGDGGLGAALAEAAEWSGRQARLVQSDAPRGAIVLACEPQHVERLEWPHLRVLGVVA
jgi:phosphoribosylformylglycinamidine synthase